MGDSLGRVLQFLDIQLQTDWTFLRTSRIEAACDNVRVFTDGTYMLLMESEEKDGICAQTIYRGMLPKEGTRTALAYTHVGNVRISSAYDSDRDLFLSIGMEQSPDCAVPCSARQEYLIDHIFDADLSGIFVASPFRSLHITYWPESSFRIKGTIPKLPVPKNDGLTLSGLEGMLVVPDSYRGVLSAAAQDMIAVVRMPAMLNATDSMRLTVTDRLNVSYKGRLLEQDGFISKDSVLYVTGAAEAITAHAHALEVYLDLKQPTPSKSL